MRSTKATVSGAVSPDPPHAASNDTAHTGSRYWSERCWCCPCLCGGLVTETAPRIRRSRRATPAAEHVRRPGELLPGLVGLTFAYCTAPSAGERHPQRGPPPRANPLLYRSDGFPLLRPLFQRKSVCARWCPL